MNILETANEIVNGERQADYGDAHTNHQRIANLWNAFLDGRERRGEIDATDAAIMMMLLKIARLQQTPDHMDSYVDIAGYAQCAVRCVKTENGHSQVNSDQH